MAECIVLKGGGDADLEVITTTQHDILAGKVAVDKDGNPVTGTMPDCRKPTKIRYWRYNNNRLEVAVDYGLHGSSWADNFYEYLEYADIGIEPWKFRADTTIAGVQGGIPVIGQAAIKASNSGINGMGLWFYIPVGYYYSSSTTNELPWVYRTLAEIAATLGIQAGSIRQGDVICGVTGTFPDYSYLFLRL